MKKEEMHKFNADKIKTNNKYKVKINKNKLQSLNEVKKDYYVTLIPPESVIDVSEKFKFYNRNKPAIHTEYKPDIIVESIKSFLKNNQIEYKKVNCKNCYFAVETEKVKNKSLFGRFYNQYELDLFYRYKISVKNNKTDKWKSEIKAEEIGLEEIFNKDKFEYKREKDNTSAIRLINSIVKEIHLNNHKDFRYVDQVSNSKSFKIETKESEDGIFWLINTKKEDAWYIFNQVKEDIGFKIIEHETRSGDMYARASDKATWKNKMQDDSIKQENIIFAIKIKYEQDNKSKLTIRRSNGENISKELALILDEKIRKGFDSFYAKKKQKVKKIYD